MNKNDFTRIRSGHGLPASDIAVYDFPSSQSSFLSFIASFGVTASSTNTNTGSWSNGYSGRLSYSSIPVDNGYFVDDGDSGLRFIHGDGSSDGLDWTVIDFGKALNGDFDGLHQHSWGRYFGGESASSGGSGALANGGTGKLWGFNANQGWVLLYQLSLGHRDSRFNHVNGKWFTQGGDVVYGDGKRSAYDTLSISSVAFSIHPDPNYPYTVNNYTQILNFPSVADAAYYSLGTTQTFLSKITSYGVTASSNNDGTSSWNAGYSGLLSYTAHIKTSSNNYFYESSGDWGLRFIHGDGSYSASDWAVIDFGPLYGGNGDFTGSSGSNKGRFFGGEPTNSGGSGGFYTGGIGSLWGFNTRTGWVELYRLPLAAGDNLYTNRAGSWFSSGGAKQCGFGKRAEYDTLPITDIAFSVGPDPGSSVLARLQNIPENNFVDVEDTSEEVDPEVSGENSELIEQARSFLAGIQGWYKGGWYGDESVSSEETE